ncbi:Rho GTPase-activating protein domain [Sesbania bispinosa]|nr:Rho GTPase-activating protein domain [Sesbania bispinosa]
MDIMEEKSVVSQKGNEVNLTLGGIDLNNSGSVVVKEDKKLLIVQFPNVRDGRAFTLKAETLKDLYEWKLALENALAQAPNAANLMGQNNILRSDQTDSLDIYLDQLKDRETIKYAVIGRPILLALEEDDGTPSFLEKALRFIEEHGVKVEGILRQAADVDDVENRVREYEQGKIEFSKEEDAHVIADCVKVS